MASLIGMLIGATLMLCIVAWIIEAAVRPLRELPPLKRAAANSVAAWLVVSILAGFGFADGGPFAWGAGLLYLPGALVWFVYQRMRLQKAWDTQENEADVFS